MLQDVWATPHILQPMPRRKSRLSPEQFAQAFEKASPRLWCLAAAVLGSRCQAEDILQEAAMTALRKLDEYEVGTSFEAWMGQIVRYTALNQGRRRYRRHEYGERDMPLDRRPGPKLAAAWDRAGWEEEGMAELDDELFDDSVRRALLALGETARTCFLLRSLSGLAYKEIAELLGIPEGTAMSHVHRSQKALRETLLGDQHFEPQAAWRAS